MFSIKKTSTLAALLILAMPISNLNAGQAEAVVLPVNQATSDSSTESLTQEEKRFEALMKKLDDAFTTTPNKISKREFLKELTSLSTFMETAFKNKAFEIFLRKHDVQKGSVQSIIITSLQDKLNKCETQKQKEIKAQNKNTTFRDNLGPIIEALTKLICDINKGFKAFIDGQSDTAQAPASAPLNPALQAQAAEVANRMGHAWSKPVAPQAGVSPVAVAPQAAHFQFTKKHWGIALIGIAALVSGMTVGQTKYKMFTRLFGKMPEVVVPQLSWWGWFFKKAIFWR